MIIVVNRMVDMFGGFLLYVLNGINFNIFNIGFFNFLLFMYEGRFKYFYCNK